MRIFELNRASRNQYPDQQLPADIRAGDFSDRDERESHTLMRELYTEYGEKFKALGLRASIGTFRSLSAKTFTIDSLDRIYMIDADKTIIRERWKEIGPVIKTFLNKRDAFDNISIERAAKVGAQRGIGPEDSKKLLDIIRLMTSKSYQRLDARAIPLLRQMTVIPSRLPRYVYRGLYYDGAKIKDREKWLEKWAPGSHPRERYGKASSWSVDQATAVDFMMAQDNVKDQKTGFHVLIRYDLSKDNSVVVADLRNIYANEFWNQQELLLSKDAIDYEVVRVFDNNTDYRGFKDASNKSIYRASGKDYGETMITNFLTSDHDIDPAYIQAWRPFKDMTTSEVNAKIGTTVSKIVPNSLFPLAAFLREFHLQGQDTDQPNIITAKESFQLWGAKELPDLTALMPEVTKSTTLIVDLMVTLRQNSFNAFVFEVKHTATRARLGYQEDIVDARPLTDYAFDKIKGIIDHKFKDEKRVKIVWT